MADIITDMTITDVNQLSTKVLSEEKTRSNLLTYARRLGCEKEMMMIYADTYKKMRLCGNEKERKDIAKLGVVQLYRLVGGGGQLYVDGELVIDDEKKGLL